MTRPGLRLVLFGLAVVLALSLAITVAAHGNSLSADAQVVQGGEVRIEGALLVTTGWVVIHTDEAGRIGDVIGHAAPAQNRFTGNLTVSVNSSALPESGEQRIWAVLHYDADGNGKFEPSADPPIGGQDDPAHAVQLDIRLGDRPAYILAEQEHAQRSNTNTVLVREVHLPADGYVVVFANDGDSPGEVVGQRALAGGRHTAVEVPVDEHFYRHQPEEFALWAAVYRSNGDGQFGDGDDPVRVNGSLVASRFRVNRTVEVHTNHTHTVAGTAEPSISTPTPSEHDDDHDHEQQPPSTTTATAPPTTRPTTPTAGAEGPGFGILAAVVGLLVGLGLTRYDRH